MATLQMLRDRLRLELGDHARGFEAKVEGDGVTTRFLLPVEYVDAARTRAFLASASTTLLPFAIDERDGAITMAAPPPNGSTLVIQGVHYEEFLNEDLDTFIGTAFTQHIHEREDEYGQPLTYADLPPVEEYLVVLLAQIEALWAMAVDAANEIDIRSPDGVMIPNGQRYQQIMGLIAMLKAKYDELANALGVGLFRIRMYNLRRVSRTTGRLVPVYRSREFDEVGPPERIFPPIDSGI
jgi:hypothetical protein